MIALHRRRVATALGGALTAGILSVAAPAFAQVVDVAVGNYYFEDGSVGDGQVTARVGDQLRFAFVEGAGHTVTISALGIDSGQLPAGSTYVTPALTTPGTYSLICTTHRARNHATTLVVTAGGGGGGGGATTTAPTTTTRPTSTTGPTTTVAGSATTSPSQGGDTTGTGTRPAAPGDTASSPADGGSLPPDAGGDDGDDASGDGTSGDDGESADAGADGGLLPVGVTGGDGRPWLRALWIALGTLPFFIGAAALAEWAARRRPRTGGPADS